MPIAEQVQLSNDPAVYYAADFILVDVTAGTRSDTIDAAGYQVMAFGQTGTMTFIGDGYQSIVNEISGTLIAHGGIGGGLYNGGSAGNNVLVSEGAAGAQTTLNGNGAGDQLFGSAAGDDIINLGSGRESVLGGGGNTTIMGGAGTGVIFTGSGLTTVYGSVNGGDTVVAGAGADTVNLEGGDAVFGGTGSLLINTGGTGTADSIVGGTGALVINGRGANMLIAANSELAYVNTGSGATLVFATSGLTNITGGAGSLQLVCGPGSTNVTEGSGQSIYDMVKGEAGGLTVINGYRPSVDQVHLFGYAPSDSSVTTVAGSTTLALTDGSKVEFVGVANLGNSVVG